MSDKREDEGMNPPDDFNPLLDGDETEEEVSLALPSFEEVEEALILPSMEDILAATPEPAPEEVKPKKSAPKKDDIDDLISDLDLEGELELDDPFLNDLMGEDLEGEAGTEAYQEAWGGLEDPLLDDDDEEEDELAGFRLDDVLAHAIETGASDVDIVANDEVGFEVLGEMHRASEFGVVTPEITTRLQLNIISHVLQSDFVENLELDTAYVLKEGPYAGRRMRLSVGKSEGEIFLVFRVIADQIPSPDDLGVPQMMRDWCTLPNGLVIICGPTGSGKSTTFASMIRQIQLTRRQKIITLEKPIEYIYGNDGLAFITQREIGRDARSFSNALKSAMRQHPKIIMVGEVRDKEEVDEVLRASETGHLALTTLHATSPPGAVNRIMSLYEGEDRLRILSSLKDNARGIANQALVRTADGKSRFAVHAMLPVNGDVAEMIGRGDVQGLQDYMRETGSTMEQQLAQATKEGRCTYEDARAQAAFPMFFDELMKNK